MLLSEAVEPFEGINFLEQIIKHNCLHQGSDGELRRGEERSSNGTFFFVVQPLISAISNNHSSEKEAFCLSEEKGWFWRKHEELPPTKIGAPPFSTFSISSSSSEVSFNVSRGRGGRMRGREGRRSSEMQLPW